MKQATTDETEETTPGAQLPTLSAADLTPAQAARMRAVLRRYFPELDDEHAPLDGGDAVETLGNLCGVLAKLGADGAE